MRQKKTLSGIYLLPNLLTTANLFAGFYSIVASLEGHFELAVLAIFIGIIADGLDGRIARLTNTETAFGAEYDSFSDMVTFGIAPALLLYSWSLNQFGKLGWLLAFVYTAAVALRLARFNTQLETADKRYFQGLSCTLAAALAASFVGLCQQHQWSINLVSIMTAVITFSVSVLMVSNLRYNSFKTIDFKGKIPFIYLIIYVLIFVAVAAHPVIMIFIGTAIYALSGPIQTLLALQRVRKKRIKSGKPK